MILDTKQRKEKTRLILTKVHNLPSMPQIMTEVLHLLNNDSTSIPQLNKSISKDQSLVAKIMTIANSPLYGLQRRVTTIDFAILILGFGEIRNIVSVLSMIESFKNKNDRYLDSKEFWLHSYLTGTAARRLAEDLGFPHGGEAFISGFLHEIGVSVIHRYLHSNFVAVAELVEDRNYSYEDAEMEVMGMTHQEVGNFLLSQWNFPEALCQAVLRHHSPTEDRENQVLTSLVHLADYMTQRLMIGDFRWDKGMRLDMQAVNLLGFEDEIEAENYITNYQELFLMQAESVRFLN